MSTEQTNTDILTAAAFMMYGFTQDAARLTQLLKHWDAGFLEITQRLTQYAAFAEACTRAGYAVVGNYPGVADYDISEAFGAWYACAVMMTEGAGHPPSHYWCLAQIRTLVVKFFTDDGSRAPSIALMEALVGVTEPVEWVL